MWIIKVNNLYRLHEKQVWWYSEHILKEFLFDYIIAYKYYKYYNQTQKYNL